MNFSVISCLRYSIFTSQTFRNKVTKKLGKKFTEKIQLESNEGTREESYGDAKLESNEETREESYRETKLESREQSYRGTKLKSNEKKD